MLFKQYDEMIRTLKIEGALLNHIRPEYLLSYPDYLAWLKTQPKERFEYVPENLLRLNIAKYTYSCDSLNCYLTSFHRCVDRSLLLDREDILSGENHGEAFQAGARSDSRKGRDPGLLHRGIESDQPAGRSDPVFL